MDGYCSKSLDDKALKISSSKINKRGRSNSDDENQDKVQRQHSDVATASSKIKRAKTVPNDDTNIRKVITTHTPPSNAMPGSIHSSQYGDRFPPEVRPLLEEWKKQWSNVKSGKSRDDPYEDTIATDEESKCQIVGCEYIRFAGRGINQRCCALHYKVAEAVQNLVRGLYCSKTGCINKATLSKSGGDKDLCLSCHRRSKHEDKEDILERTEDDIRKHAREVGLPKVIERYNELQLEYPGAAITLYTGQSIDTDARFQKHNKAPLTKDYVDKMEVEQVTNIYEANDYEHELIKASAEYFGKEYIINRMPGGGNVKPNMNIKSTIYTLFYTRHSLRAGNKVDYSDEPTFPATSQPRKLPKMPQLPDMPLFWNRITFSTSIKMLGYNTVSLQEVRKRNAQYPCTFESCTEVFADIEDYRTHYRTIHYKADQKAAERCPIAPCHMSFARKEDLDMHIELMHPETAERFYCTIAGCSKSYTWKGDLTKHIKQDHPETLGLPPTERFYCTIAGCSKSYTWKQDLNTHIKQDHPETLGLSLAERFECTVAGCSQNYKNKSTLKRHIKQDHPETLGLEPAERFYCTIAGCSKSYTWKQDLNTHIKQDHPETLGLSLAEGFECTVAGCSKNYKNKNTLKRHIKQDHPETLGLEPATRFECTVEGCDRSYKGKDDLNCHIKYDHPETLGLETKRFQCTVEGCDRSYKRKGDLTRHIKTHRKT